MGKRMMRIGNHIGVWMYRTLDGRLASGSKDVHVLMLTTPGRRTGLPRSTCVRYLETPDGLMVWGTGSGSPQVPAWFRNLRAVETTDVQRQVVGVATGSGSFRRSDLAACRSSASLWPKAWRYDPSADRSSRSSSGCSSIVYILPR